MIDRACRVVVIAAALGAAACSSDSPGPVRAVHLPRWEATSLVDASAIRLDAADGAIILNVWATWCAPCRREMASLEAAHRILAARGIRVVGVSVDRDVLLAREFVRRAGITFTNLSDPTQALVRDRLGVRQLPTTMAFGADGRQRWREEVARDWAAPSRLAWVERSFGPGWR